MFLRALAWLLIGVLLSVMAIWCCAIADSVMQAVVRVFPRRDDREGKMLLVLDTVSVAGTLFSLFWKWYGG